MSRFAWFSALPLVLACSSSDPATSGAGGGGMSGVAVAGQAGEPAITLAGDGGAGFGGALSAMGGAGSAGESAVGGASAGRGGSNSGGSPGSGGGAGGSAPVKAAISWLGRVSPTATGARMAWPGTGFGARFNGTGAHVSLKTDNVDYFEVVVDDQATVLTTQAGTHPYDLAKGLSAGDHTVTMWRRTEPLNGNAEVLAVTFDGTLLAPPVAPNKRLEIVGDSISVGFGVECKTQGEAFAYLTENNYLTYEALTARKLGADLFTEAWSGIGVWRDVGGGMTNQMPVRYQRTLPNDAASTWDFSKYVPDAVVVLLGTNDFAKGDPGQPFVDAYTTFVSSLRTHYPKARQYFAVSPMLGGTNRTLVKQYIASVISTRNNAGDKNVSSIEFAQPAPDAWGCGHPDGATHAIMAGLLEAALHADLGW